MKSNKINDELANCNAQLSRLNNDLANIQTAAHSAIVLLGRDLTIRWFSAQAASHFNLVATDIGRPLSQVWHDLTLEECCAQAAPVETALATNVGRRRTDRDPRRPPDVIGANDIDGLIGEVMATMRECEREARDREGRWYSLRVRPYLTLDNELDGAVLVLVDIDDLKCHEQAVTAAWDYVEAIVETARDPLVILNADLSVHAANLAFYDTFKVSRAESEGRLIYELGNRQWDIPQLRQLLEEILPQHNFFNDFEVRHNFESIGWRTLLLNVRRLNDTSGRPASILLGIEDVTHASSENAQKFKLLFDRSPLPKWVVELETLRFLDVNEAAVEHYGYSREEFLGMSVLDVGTREAGEALQAALARPPHRPPERDSCQHRKKSGHVIDVELRSSEITLAGKRAWLATINDISERKRTEEALRKSEQRFAQFMQHLPGLAWIKDSEGQYVYANDAAERVFRTQRADLYGKTDQELFPPETAAQFTRNDQRALASESGIQTIETLTHADTVVHHSIVSKFPIPAPDGKEIMVGGVAFDISEQKRAEEAQRELTEKLATELAATQRLQQTSTQIIHEGNLEALYQQILEAAMGIMHSDMASLQMLDEGQDALRILAWRGFDAALGRIFELSHSDTRTACSVARRVGHRVVVPDVETCDFIVGTTALQDHRKARIRAVQSTPLFSRGGRMLGMISTHWRNPHQPVERDLRLLDILARQAADLMERGLAEEALREAHRRKDEFLAMLAHELRNPLAPIRNALEIMRLAEGNPEVVRSASGMMDRQIDQMVRLIDDLLDVSRITRGTIELRRGFIDLASCVDHAVEAARPLCQSKGLKLTVALPAAPVYLNADPIRLAQVVGNLLNNACKFTDKDGRVWLTAEVVTSEATVERSNGGARLSGPPASETGTEALKVTTYPLPLATPQFGIPHVVIRVRDTGIGLSSDQLRCIFEMFTQVDTSLERTRSGLGIGLTLAKTLVELHGGMLEAYSPGLGHGSEFVVRLPIIIEIPKPQPAGPAITESTTVTARRILVVDDNIDSAESLTALLDLGGHATRSAYDGQEAVEAAMNFQPDVVLLDIGLPELNGYDVARKIREQPWGQRVVLVALTGWGQEEDRRRSKEAGFNHHLTKPVDPLALKKLLAGLSPS